MAIRKVGGEFADFGGVDLGPLSATRKSADSESFICYPLISLCVCYLRPLIFITLKLTGLVDWSWLWVLSPIWITFVAVCLYIVILLTAKQAIIDMAEAIVIDIDGTLMDVSHRRHHVSGDNQNWSAFFDAIRGDSPRHTVIRMVEALVRAEEDTQFFICTGRPDSHRQDTETQLSENCEVLWAAVGSEYLLMREEGDYRADYKLKEKMLHDIEAQGFEVVYTIDDRQSVVDMWRAKGIVCFQCDSGDWDKRTNYSPGKLYMLVGPSGAGKSEYAKANFPASSIVSSDALRAELSGGDILDQSRNAQVFSALHAIVHARISAGLDTVVDATNIKNRNRKAILALVPRTCGVEYHVVDRPLPDKIQTQGWRADVRVKGKSLVEYHDEVFRANKKDIMDGDGDQRVSVIEAVL